MHIIAVHAAEPRYCAAARIAVWQGPARRRQCGAHRKRIVFEASAEHSLERTTARAQHKAKNARERKPPLFRARCLVKSHDKVDLDGSCYRAKASREQKL